MTTTCLGRSLSATVWPRPQVNVSHVNRVLPLVGDAATGDFLSGLEISGLRYHSWRALDYSNGAVHGAIVIFGSPE